MTNDPISQAEIDALLRGALGQEGGDATPAAPAPAAHAPAPALSAPPAPGRGGDLMAGSRPGAGEDWSALQAAAADALEGAWSVATALLGAPAQVGEVQVLVMTAGEAMSRFGPDTVWGRIALAEGPAYVLMPQHLSLQMIGLMLGGLVPTELNATGTAALAEALGQLTGKALARVTSQAGWAPGLTPVEVIPAAAAPAAGLPPADAPLVVVHHPVQLGTAAGGGMGLALLLEPARRLTVALNGAAAASPPNPPRPDAAVAGRPPGTPDPAMAAAMNWGAPPPQMGPQPAYPPQPAPAATASGYGGGYGQQPGPPLAPGPAVSYQSVQFRDLAPAEVPAAQRNIDLLMDVTLQVTVELGRTRKQIRDVLAMGPGLVIELEKLAGEPVDVLVNGKLIARGEVVVIEEHFGVRITDIITPAERAASLGR